MPKAIISNTRNLNKKDNKNKKNDRGQDIKIPLHTQSLSFKFLMNINV